jgi:hypothetical protein
MSEVADDESCDISTCTELTFRVALLNTKLNSRNENEESTGETLTKYTSKENRLHEMIKKAQSF